MAKKQSARLAVERVLVDALEELGGGAVMVLDAELRILASSPAADALLGGSAPVGARAPSVLYGGAVERPIARALAAGRPISVTIARPDLPSNSARPAGGDHPLRVTTTPIHDQGHRVGWVLALRDEPVSVDGPVLFHGMWTADPAMKRLFRVVERVAGSDASVLVRGETGAGKELVSAALHALSPRRAGPFRAINCAAMPAALLESELFGHVRGAFTGAVRDSPGHLRLADRGTLFLDEVAELPLELQAKLLRVLESRAVLPVGAREPVPVDVRIVAATHRSLRKEVEAGRFRADLMYRLRVIPIFLPPLRARGDDVVLLAERFIEEMSTRSTRKIVRIAPSAKAALLRYDWPGNVRELRNALEYAFAIGEGPVLVEADLPPELIDPTEAGEPAPIHPVTAHAPPSIDEAHGPEAAKILRALERAGQNRERAAQMLGISRVTLWRRLRDLGLQHER
jgi:transcriptional regulator with PAS, ATPase and Fis domain